MAAIIFDNSSASLNNSPILSWFTCSVSRIKQSQYFVSFADFKAIEKNE